MSDRNTVLWLLSAGLLLLVSAGCGGNEGNETPRLHFEEQGRSVPDFKADSAYHFVQKQVDFGYRNPGSEGHRKTLDYLVSKMQAYAGSQLVYKQEFTEAGYDDEKLELTNVIAAFNPQARDRIMISAHWDTRPRADQGDTLKNQPIPGADDGGSGTAVLLELARLFSQKQPPIGVDLVLFDGEDYGKSGSLDKYFLGSRYWSKHPPVKGYSPRFGILLDMVGGEGARYPKEGYSLRYAPALVNELWSIADQKGFGNYFPDQQGGYISDDHVIINQNLGIPTIDIVRHQKVSADSIAFAPYWHTQNDNMSIISNKTLGAVGEVITELVYNRIR